MRAASPTANNRRGAPRLLLVEDDYLMATDLEAVLSEAGLVVVRVAATADEAVMLAESERPTVVIMDVHLRGERDGVDAALDIFSKTGIRCIFATAHQDREVRARAEAAQPLAWLAKPYAPAALVAAVQEALAHIKNDRN